MFNGSLGPAWRPFSAVPLVDHYFPAAAIDGARSNLIRCVERGEGPGMVVGPSGTGKTLLCLTLAEQFRKTFRVAMLSSGRLSTRRALFQAILYELGRPYRDMDEGELRLALIDCLEGNEDWPNGLTLLVDEAHTLPLRLLEELRLLSNLASRGRPLVRLVLAGSPALEESFANPRLDSFSQRLGVRCYLEAFNGVETRDYIQSRIDASGASGEAVFPEDACRSVHQATGGVPRLINQVCDHALLLVFVAGRESVAPADVEEAWADLQQLPVPCGSEASGDRTEGGVIEFGSLDESAESGTDRADSAVFRVAGVEDEEENEEPAGKIHRIERLLAKAEEDFQPAGSIGPEVEMNFEEQIHPFQEEYEEEEVVADRYAAARERQPMTFGTSAYAMDYEPPTAAGHLAERSADVCIVEEPEPPSDLGSVDTVTATPVEQNLPVEQNAPAEQAAPPTVEQRRHEYRQLFSRLRRG